MRQVKVYQCDKCGATYKEMQKAIECEAKHLTPEYTECEYSTGYTMPHTVKIGFNNEKVGIYKLIRVEEVEDELCGTE